ncbi:MAG: hypothetical protein JHD15_11895 [Phenylobacterium sp.]|jgi:hypothetical protein|uniref:hypothetical protein n=1 Tax=Phenylobacterium sp. TaxID=1871053 RepID=UPI001A330F8A|nr:hypothetical protein [Phenylobacterium sp.]MBJ7411047.1 hypothetical protein [Phenylobacterium sp.]
MTWRNARRRRSAKDRGPTSESPASLRIAELKRDKAASRDEIALLEAGLLSRN